MKKMKNRQGVGAAAASVSNFVDFSFISINKQQHFEWSLDIIATTTTTTIITTTTIPTPTHSRTLRCGGADVDVNGDAGCAAYCTAH